MGEHPFRLGPAASFDAEIARVSTELSADVAFRLVERERDQAMDSCWIHRQDKPREATRTVRVDGPNGFHKEVGACYRHATDLEAGDYERLKQDANPGRAEQIIAAAKRQDMTITVDRRDREPDLGRNTIGLNTPADREPPSRPARSYDDAPRTPPRDPDPPCYDGGRLVERC